MDRSCSIKAEELETQSHLTQKPLDRFFPLLLTVSGRERRKEPESNEGLYVESHPRLRAEHLGGLF